MKIYFLLLELFIYVFAIYVFVKKKELCILYIPVLCFSHTVISGPLLPAVFFMGVMSILLFRVISENRSFLKNNVFSVLIIIYFLVLITRSAGTSPVRENFMNVILYFLAIPLISSLYEKYSRKVIFAELSRSALLVILIFISNVLLSTLFRFNPFAMYHISGGIVFGNLIYTDFNILTVSIFLVFYGAMQNKNIWHLIICVVALCFVAVSLRRSVMLTSVIGIFFSALILMRQHAKQIIILGVVGSLVGSVIVVQTGLIDTFNERYELRKLDNRDIEEEKRFIEYELLYDDMFVYHRYSPWVGYELFNSPGNYGGGVFFTRSLHGDFTNIAHSSGIIGVILYILMFLVAFYRCFRACESRADRLIVLFTFFNFMTFTGTGRYTEFGCMLLTFLTASLPFAKEEEAQPEWEFEYLT